MEKNVRGGMMNSSDIAMLYQFRPDLAQTNYSNSRKLTMRYLGKLRELQEQKKTPMNFYLPSLHVPPSMSDNIQNMLLVITSPRLEKEVLLPYVAASYGLETAYSSFYTAQQAL